MAWYRTGTVTVTNGSATVAGAGTDFVSNTQIGEVFLGPDGRVYEIVAVVSATQLTIVPVYQGATAGGQAYGLQPTASFARDLALLAAQLLNSFGAVRDGVGQGLFPDGTLAAPGIRFANDQDTGFQPQGPNTIGIVLGGATRARFEPDGTLRIGSTETAGSLAIPSRYGWFNIQPDGQNAGVGTRLFYTWANGGQGSLIFARADGDVARFDPSGNLLVGVGSGSFHRISKGSNQGTAILEVSGPVTSGVAFYASLSASYGNAAAATMKVTRNTDTGRSIGAEGTINASGADYAEYMTKAAGCGTIAPGDVCGVDKDGHLTRTWADAASFVVKSTDPAYVGGDSWAQHLPPRPEAPGAEPPAPVSPGDLPDSDDDAALAAWRDAAAAYPALLAAHNAARATWQAETDAHARDLAAWEAALEAERVKVDRIAFCGQVPVNITGDFAVGDYLIAAAAGAGIKAVAVPEADITFDQYRRRLGKVWAVRDGRAWVDVQHG